MWVYEAQFIPGLLQTEDYARAVAADALATAGHKAREQFVRDQLARQQVLIQCDDALGLSVILSEGALRQVAGSRTVMRGQLNRLIDVSRSQPSVTVQVLPFTTGTHASGSGPFTIMSFPGPQHVAVVRLAGQTSGVYLEDEEDIARYAVVFQHLRASALPPAASARLIKDVAKDL
jgi:Domain of unknown function (DUF5753)